MTAAQSTVESSPTLHYLHAARKHHTQAAIASALGVDVRTVRRWEIRSSEPPPYIVPALQRLLPLDEPTGSGGRFRFIDLFAGIGGIRLPFEKLGGQCVFTSEWDDYAQKTYAANFPGGHHIHGDITKIDASDIPDHDLLLAGFPCQPFSIAGVSKKNALGRAHGFADETQGTLFFDVARIIKEKRPRAFLLENVKNLQSHDRGRTFATITRVLKEELGYDIHVRVVDGARFVPQHRERILIAGFAQPVSFDWDAIALPPRGQHKLRDILHRTDGSEPVVAHDDGRFFHHDARKVNPKYTLTAHLWTYLQNYAAKHKAKGNGFGFGLVGPDDIARTLSARYYKDGSEILIDQGPKVSPRRLTPRECARLLGFPDTFRIPVSDTRAYRQFADAAMPPMVQGMADAVVSIITTPAAEPAEPVPSVAERKGSLTMQSGLWSKDQLKLAFHLYCQLPFGRLHQRNPEIVELAGLIKRTPSAVAMKLVNFASLDPSITGTGRKGLGNASAKDREVWNEFNADWEALAVECFALRQSLSENVTAMIDDEIRRNDDADQSFTGETVVTLTARRIKQSFFRRAVLSSYRGKCCMSGTTEPRLLVASHIVPWSDDKSNRLNPSNGLCLSAIHDRAFDRGLISLTDDLRILLSAELRGQKDEFTRTVFLQAEGKSIEAPERFAPRADFIAHHRRAVFLGN